jgi:hypothetical protein
MSSRVAACSERTRGAMRRSRRNVLPGATANLPAHILRLSGDDGGQRHRGGGDQTADLFGRQGLEGSRRAVH